MKGKIFYRFASEQSFREFECAFPVSAFTVRNQLKRKLLIASPLDIVIYLIKQDGKASRHALLDNATIDDGQKLLAKRVPESLAKSILAVATEQANKDHSHKLLSGSSEDISSKASSSMVDLYEGLEAVSDSDEEESDKELLVIQQSPSNIPSLEASCYIAANHSSRTPLSEVSSSDSSEYSPLTSRFTPPPSSSPLPLLNQVDRSSNNLPSVVTCSKVDSQKEQFNPETDFNYEEDDDSEEQLMMQKIMLEQQSTSPCTSQRNDRLSHQGMPKFRDNLASRYYRSRNLTWSKNSERSQDSYAQQLRVLASSRGPGVSATRNIGHQGSAIVSVKENYVCHICGEKGHHIRNCPKGNDPKKQKKVKPSTGLPRSWLQRIPDHRVAQCDCDVYCLPGWNDRHREGDINNGKGCHWDGTFAILKPLATAASTIMSQPVESKIHQRFGVGTQAIADHLRCPLCHRLFNDAVLTPCCGETFCRSCVLSRLSASLSSSDISVDDDFSTIATAHSSSHDSRNGGNNTRGRCPSCDEVINSADLEFNRVLQDSVEGVLRVGRLQPSSLWQQQWCHSMTSNDQLEKDTSCLRKPFDENIVEKPVPQALPPGTIRQVEVPVGIKPIPLGGRLAQPVKKRSLSTTPITSNSLIMGQPAKKQAVK